MFNKKESKLKAAGVADDTVLRRLTGGCGLVVNGIAKVSGGNGLSSHKPWLVRWPQGGIRGARSPAEGPTGVSTAECGPPGMRDCVCPHTGPGYGPLTDATANGHI